MWTTDTAQIGVPSELHPLSPLTVAQVAGFLAQQPPDAWVYYNATLGVLVTYKFSDQPQDAQD
jgi:hypothetical protein